MTTLENELKGRQRVRVPGRAEPAVKIDGGKSIGSDRPVYCVGVCLPETGAIRYYEETVVTDWSE